jgi:hypothetical protein
MVINNPVDEYVMREWNTFCVVRNMIKLAKTIERGERIEIEQQYILGFRAALKDYESLPRNCWVKKLIAPLSYEPETAFRKLE